MNVEVLVALGVLVTLAVLLVTALALVGPSLAEAAERARLEREAQAASWRIHQQASRAVTEMLEATRDIRRDSGR